MQINGKYRCMYCFNELNNENETCRCNYDQTQYKLNTIWLKAGTILDNRYCVGKVIGGRYTKITYCGYDLELDKKIVIRELCFRDINSRDSAVTNELGVRHEEDKDIFDAYQTEFLDEAKEVAKLENGDGIVSILNCFKRNNTAYIIMEYLDGETLEQYIKRKRTLSVEETFEILFPIMRTLVELHAVNLIHRGISPDNIVLTPNDKVKLLYLCSAYELSCELEYRTVMTPHKYTSIERFQSHGKQGPWTDVYSLSATIYKCLTGKDPSEVMERMMDEDLEPVYVITPACPKKVSDVIMKGLAIMQSDRYQSIEEFVEDFRKAYMQRVRGLFNRRFLKMLNEIIYQKNC